MQFAAPDGVVPVHYSLGVVVVHVDVPETLVETSVGIVTILPRGSVLQVVDLQRVGKGNLFRTESHIYVRNFYDCFGVFPVLRKIT